MTPNMPLDTPLTLLGGMTPRRFMRDYWQKRPLLIRQAFPGLTPPVKPAELRRLSRTDAVESRLIWREDNQWCMEQGPFGRLPSERTREWTLLVQSMDVHDDACANLLHQFNFVPSARLDDLMISIATDGGGVGPHFDSYDVFLIQASGQRRWKFGLQKNLSLIADLPLKILADFEPEQDFVLDPGDMLYLPPQAAHDGIAVGNNCMTLSVGFRAPDAATLARGMLEAAADQIAARSGDGASPVADPPLPGPDLSKRFTDPKQLPTSEPAMLPDTLIQETLAAVHKLRFDESLATRYLGCWLTEPNALAVFSPKDEVPELTAGISLRLDRRSRMLYRGKDIFINGERAPLKPSALLKRLANERALLVTPKVLRVLTDDERDCLAQWLESGWLVATR
jgi:50S ribosomal protein L16 3-hydroxylase